MKGDLPPKRPPTVFPTNFNTSSVSVRNWATPTSAKSDSALPTLRFRPSRIEAIWKKLPPPPTSFGEALASLGRWTNTPLEPYDRLTPEMQSFLRNLGAKYPEPPGFDDRPPASRTSTRTSAEGAVTYPTKAKLTLAIRHYPPHRFPAKPLAQWVRCQRCNLPYMTCLPDGVWRDLTTIPTESALKARLKASKVLSNSDGFSTLLHLTRGSERMQLALFELWAESKFPELKAIFVAHGTFLSPTLVLETLAMSPMLPRDHSVDLVANNLSSVITSWKDRHALLFFVVQLIPYQSRRRTKSSLATEVAAKHVLEATGHLGNIAVPTQNYSTTINMSNSGPLHPLPDDEISLTSLETYLQKTMRDALLGTLSTHTETRITCLSYLIDLFWLLSSEAVQLRRREIGGPLVATATRARTVLMALIRKADDVETHSFPHGAMSFLKTFYCQLRLKRTLTRLAESLSKQDNADRRTEKLRRTLANGIHAFSPSRAHPMTSVPANLSSYSLPASPRGMSPGCYTPRQRQPASEPAPTRGSPLAFRTRPGSEVHTAAPVPRLKQTGSLFSLSALFNPTPDEEVRSQAIRDHEILLESTIRKTNAFKDPTRGPRGDMEKPLALSFPLPTDPTLWFTGVNASQSFVIRSSKYPLVLSCNVRNPITGAVATKKFLFKSNDDLRQDLLTIQLLRWFEARIFQDLYGIATHLFRYQVLPMSCHEGLIEFVENATPISQLKKSNEISLKTILEGRHLANVPLDPEIALAPSVDNVDAFIASSAAYSVLTYVLGVGDRHQDNLMVDTLGRFFHIDFGYILGNDPKPFAQVPMKITKEMVESLGGLQSATYEAFCGQCAHLFYIMRRRSSEFSTLLSLTFSSDIPDVRRLRNLLVQQVNGGEDAAGSSVAAGTSPSHRRVYKDSFWLFKLKVAERLRLDLDGAEAVRFLMRDVVDVSVRSLFPMVVDKLHEWALYWS